MTNINDNRVERLKDAINQAGDFYGSDRAKEELLKLIDASEALTKKVRVEFNTTSYGTTAYKVSQLVNSIQQSLDDDLKYVFRALNAKKFGGWYADIDPDQHRNITDGTEYEVIKPYTHSASVVEAPEIQHELKVAAL